MLENRFCKTIFSEHVCNRFCKDALVFTREDDENDFERMLTISNGGEGEIFFMIFVGF